MADNRHYWNSKDQMAQIAIDHTQEMSQKYHKEIISSAKRSRIYGPNSVNVDSVNEEGTPKIIVQNLDSVSAIFQETEGKTCVLNFASFKNPGGMFIAGSKAQEECLCHDSFLYNVLRFRMDYYEWNRKNLMRSLYKNRALYSPDIIFSKNEQTRTCDVLTCAAPNFSAAHKYCHVSRSENHFVLKQRIHFLLSVAAAEKVNNLILGAFGCGVFGQDPAEVANLFHQEIALIFGKTNIKIVFAIPKSQRDNNYESFKKSFPLPKMTIL